MDRASVLRVIELALPCHLCYRVRRRDELTSDPAHYSFLSAKYPWVTEGGEADVCVAVFTSVTGRSLDHDGLVGDDPHHAR